MSNLIPQRTDEVVLYQGDDQHEIDRLRQAVEKAAESATEWVARKHEDRVAARLRARSGAQRVGDEAPTEEPLPQIGDDPDLVAAAEAFDAFVAEAAERGVKVVVKTIGRKWRTLAAEHPPREDNDNDEEWGWNVATFGEVVVPLCVVSIGGTELDEKQAAEQVDQMSDGDFKRVLAAAVKINTGRGPDPKASISAMLPKTSPEISESPERLG